MSICRLPDDIWLVDLDSNKLTPPSGSNEEIPLLPEPEGTILKNHLKQVTMSSFTLRFGKSLYRMNFHATEMDSFVSTAKVFTIFFNSCRNCARNVLFSTQNFNSSKFFSKFITIRFAQAQDCLYFIYFAFSHCGYFLIIIIINKRRNNFFNETTINVLNLFLMQHNRISVYCVYFLLISFFFSFLLLFNLNFEKKMNETRLCNLWIKQELV